MNCNLTTLDLNTQRLEGNRANNNDYAKGYAFAQTCIRRALAWEENFTVIHRAVGTAFEPTAVTAYYLRGISDALLLATQQALNGLTYGNNHMEESYDRLNCLYREAKWRADRNQLNVMTVKPLFVNDDDVTIEAEVEAELEQRALDQQRASDEAAHAEEIAKDVQKDKDYTSRRRDLICAAARRVLRNLNQQDRGYYAQLLSLLHARARYSNHVLNAKRVVAKSAPAMRALIDALTN